MAKVTFEFDFHDDAEMIEMHMKCRDYYSALHDIYNMVRSELKHVDEELSDHIERLLEEIKQMSGEFI